MLFFGGGAGGVFGNAVAGWRGALFGGVLNGILLAFGQWISWGLYSGTAPELATLADPDWFAVGWIIIGLGNLFAPLGVGGVWVIALVAVVVSVVTLVLLGRRQRRRGVAPVVAPATVPVGAPSTGTDAAASAAAVATAAGTAARPQPLTVLAVCGAGMGSSLILRTTAEKALNQLGVEASLSHTDVSSARGQSPDVVIAQPTYLSELGDLAPVMVPITSFVDANHVRERLAEKLAEKGWL
jgi:PTS system ascorbate-specific IIC component